MIHLSANIRDANGFAGLQEKLFDELSKEVKPTVPVTSRKPRVFTPDEVVNYARAHRPLSCKRTRFVQIVFRFGGYTSEGRLIELW